MTRRWRGRVAFTAAAAIAALSGSAIAATSVGGGVGVGVRIFYGPTCHAQYGGKVCASPPVAGIHITASRYPDGRLLGSSVSDGFGQTGFASLSGPVLFAFARRLHGNDYRVQFHMNVPASAPVMVIPLDVLLCPSGAWVATFVAPANTCARPVGVGVVARGAAVGAA